MYIQPTIKKDNTVCLEYHNNVYKLVKITPQKDGGFNVHIPYCKYKNGFLGKCKVSYERESMIYWNKDFLKKFTAEQDIKLSIHRSGFVQFSGKEIVSGLNNDNDFKGLGLFSAPIDKPIETGPTVILSFWGIEEFDLLGSGTSQKKNFIIFEEDKLPLRHCEQNNFNGFLLEVFLFRLDCYYNQIVFEDSKPYMYLRAMQFEETGKLFKFRIVFIKNSPSFLGLVVSKIKHGFNKSSCGYSLGSPTQIIDFKNGCPIAESLMAIYSKEDFLDCYNFPTIKYNAFKVESKDKSKVDNDKPDKIC